MKTHYFARACRMVTIRRALSRGRSAGREGCNDGERLPSTTSPAAGTHTQPGAAARHSCRSPAPASSLETGWPLPRLPVGIVRRYPRRKTPRVTQRRGPALAKAPDHFGVPSSRLFSACAGKRGLVRAQRGFCQPRGPDRLCAAPSRKSWGSPRASAPASPAAGSTAASAARRGEVCAAERAARSPLPAAREGRRNTQKRASTRGTQFELRPSPTQSPAHLCGPVPGSNTLVLVWLNLKVSNAQKLILFLNDPPKKRMSSASLPLRRETRRSSPDAATVLPAARQSAGGQRAGLERDRPRKGSRSPAVGLRRRCPPQPALPSSDIYKPRRQSV